MTIEKPQNALAFVNQLVADGITSFSFEDAVRWARRSPTATANLLRRLKEHGLVDRVRQGHYAIRQLGVLGTGAAGESVALAVGAAFAACPHRIAYRSALDEHDLISHPSRTIQVATTREHRVRSSTLSGRPLRVVLESKEAVTVGAEPTGPSWVSDVNRALLEACARPELVGGAGVLAEAVVTGSKAADPQRLQHYAQRLGWAAALRRLGSLADALAAHGLAGRLEPLTSPKSDVRLEPAARTSHPWRDRKWRVVWPQAPEELANVARQ